MALNNKPRADKPRADKPHGDMSRAETSPNPRTPRTARKARPKNSLKMQAIGFLSRREHSRQELRTKLLAALRKRERDEAHLAAAAEAAAKEIAEALEAQPSNGIDDAFAPPMPTAVTPAWRSAGLTAASPAAREALSRQVGDDAPGQHASARGVEAPLVDVSPPRVLRRTDAAPASLSPSILDSLRVAGGGALPAHLRTNPVLVASLGSVSTAEQRAPAGAITFDESEIADDIVADAAPVFRAQANERADVDEADAPDLEREDPEAAVDRLLDWLVANGYLSDARFVESRVNARARKQGATRIRHELSRHGLALEPDQAAKLRETEFTRAQAIWQRKFGEVGVDARARAKQARFLASRGFASEVVRRLVGGEEEF